MTQTTVADTSTQDMYRAHMYACLIRTGMAPADAETASEETYPRDRR